MLELSFFIVQMCLFKKFAKKQVPFAFELRYLYFINYWLIVKTILCTFFMRQYVVALACYDIGISKFQLRGHKNEKR